MLSNNAVDLMKKRYMYDGETPESALRRVAKALSIRDKAFEKELYDAMSNSIFFPNSPALRNAGKKKGMLSACFVIPIEDSIKNIFETASNMAQIFQRGGGVGINFGPLRPEKAPLSSGGTSSGAVSFMGVFDAVIHTVKQGGFRRGAALGTLPHYHPEIFKFCGAKLTRTLTNFNLSILVTDDFMKKATENGGFVELIHNGEIYKSVRARDILDIAAFGAWVSGDPGLLFYDRINRDNKNPEVPIVCTNPSLAKGTRVLTSTGIYSIEDLDGKEFKVLTLNSEYSNAKCFLSGNGKQLYEIKLQGGHTYYATAEHKWPILWNKSYIKVRTDGLRVGDYLPITKVNSLNYGELGTYDDGFLVGWNLGDGSLTIRSDNGKQQFGFYFSKTDFDNGIFQKVKGMLKGVTGEEYNPTPRNNFYEISSSNKKLCDFFNKFGIQNKKGGLPTKIWNECSEAFRRGLVDGLMSSSDGSIEKSDRNKNKSRMVVFSSAHEKLTTDLSNLLGFYGIKTSISYSDVKAEFPNGKDYKKLYKCYRLRFWGDSAIHFRNIFKLSHLLKQQKLDDFANMKKRGVLFDNVQIVSVKVTERYEDVWDIQVYDQSHTFKIDHCTTGNCGEEPLPPYGACCLGSLNLTKFVDGNNFQFDKFYDYVKMAGRALLNINTINWYPIPQIHKVMSELNPIGIGVMGFADALIMLGIRYDSNDCLDFIDKLSKPYIQGSEEVAPDSFYKRSIVPTGSVSILADCSPSIEPVFARNFERHVVAGVFKECRDIYSSAVCRTAHEISPDWHLKVQAKFQSFIDAGVSKTVNVPNDVGADDIKQIYIQAWKMGVKGITVFRDGSIDGVLVSKEEKPKKACDDPETCML